MTDFSSTIGARPRRAKSGYNPEATRRAILDAAYDEFAERGRFGASMRAVARRAGCPQSLVHHHFGSKDGLWRAVANQIAQNWLDIGDAFLTDESPDQAAVRGVLSNLWRFWPENPRALRMNAWRLLEGLPDSDLAASNSRYRQLLDAFKRAQQTGAVRNDLPADIIVMAVYGAITQACLALASTGREVAPFSNSEQILEGVYALVAP